MSNLSDLTTLIQALESELDGLGYVIIAACTNQGPLTYRCLPTDAKHWRIYVAQRAWCDLADVEVAVLVAREVFENLDGVEVEFDVGSTSFLGGSMDLCLSQAVDEATRSNDLAHGLVPLIEALQRASSSHGIFDMVSRHDPEKIRIRHS